MSHASPLSSLRPARQAGRFYEAQPERLRATIRAMLDEAPAPALPRRPLALVAPHAGYQYSGPVAAAAYRQLEGCTVDGVLLLAPSHYVDFTGAALPAATAFATPLGQVAIDTAAATELAGRPGFMTDDGPHDAEHAIEVQLPFLQMALEKPFSLLPLALGRPPREAVLESLAAPLLDLLTRRAAAGQTWLLVASTDTYHGYDVAACEANDERLAGLIEKMAAEEIVEQTRQRTVMACGWYPLALITTLARSLGARGGQILKRGDSQAGGGSGSDYVVGYLAAAFA